ncbi:hypothetical protein Tco_0925457 [Tanacetum coccineum]|uniref:Uncharacterized protein n=1 Tax=Tanacetum coccineum TaxID=301880 RepID=A0ABQ5D9Q6_9ASTR
MREATKLSTWRIREIEKGRVSLASGCMRSPRHKLSAVRLLDISGVEVAPMLPIRLEISESSDVRVGREHDAVISEKMERCLSAGYGNRWSERGPGPSSVVY